MIVYEQRAYLVFVLVCCVAFAVFFAVAALWDINSRSAFLAIGFAICVFAAHYYFRRLQRNRPLAVLTPTGVTDDYGHTFTWDQITKIHTFTGVLFIKDKAKAGWRIRLDPTEVGRDQVRAAIAFIKQHAPSHLTERL